MGSCLCHLVGGLAPAHLCNLVPWSEIRTFWSRTYHPDNVCHVLRTCLGGQSCALHIDPHADKVTGIGVQNRHGECLSWPVHRAAGERDTNPTSPQMATYSRRASQYMLREYFLSDGVALTSTCLSFAMLPPIFKAISMGSIPAMVVWMPSWNSSAPSRRMSLALGRATVCGVVRVPRDSSVLTTANLLVCHRCYPHGTGWPLQKAFPTAAAISLYSV